MVTRHFETNAGYVYARYSIQDNVYEIVDATNKILFTGKSPSPHKAKLKIKKHLKFLGVEFEQEIRKPLIHL
jgi:hypothetical protein